MLATKTRTLIVTVVASASLAAASIAPAASQALRPVQPVRPGLGEGSQFKACEIHQGWYEFWRDETIRAIENFEYADAVHYAENAASEKAAAQSEGCLDTDTWATVPSSPPLHRSPGPSTPPLSIT